MEGVIVGFSKPKKWKPFAWLIMQAYDIPYNHVYVRFYSEFYERNLIYQASGTKVNFMGEDLFLQDNDVIAEFELSITNEQKKAMIQFAIDSCGQAYGIKAVVGLAWVRICEWFGKVVKNPFRDGKTTYVCSELGAYILENYAHLKLPKNYEDITPKDLYECLLKTKEG